LGPPAFVCVVIARVRLLWPEFLRAPEASDLSLVLHLPVVFPSQLRPPMLQQTLLLADARHLTPR
jgi:hypothetical protein